MKNNKIIIMLFVLFSSTLFLLSCSNEIEQLTNNSSQDKLETLLKSFYSNNYRLGDKEKVTIQNNNGNHLKTSQIENYTITEVFVGGEEKARGYIFENILTDEVETFIDVDRTNFKVTSVDLENLQTSIKNAINQMPQYYLSDEFDIIKIITDPIFTNPTNPINVTLGWREEPGACGPGPNGNFRGFYRAYYLFGIRLTKWEPVYNDNGTRKTEPC
jgi:hypothetical protein